MLTGEEHRDVTRGTHPAAGDAAGHRRPPGGPGVYSSNIMNDNSRLKVDVAIDERIVTIHGDMDLRTAPEVDRAIEGLGGDGDVVLDMTGVTFMDSSGLRTVVARRQVLEDAGHRLVISDPSDPVRRVLEITGLESHLDISES